MWPDGMARIPQAGQSCMCSAQADAEHKGQIQERCPNQQDSFSAGQGLRLWDK